MRLDASLAFVALGAPLSITTAADYPSSVVDLLGQGVGTIPFNIIGNVSLFGEDAGVGGRRPELMIGIGTVFAGGTSLQVKFQASPDVAVTHVPTTWTTLVETPAILTASLTAGAVIARFPFLPAVPAGLNPRFLRLVFTGVGTFTTGTIAFALPTFVRDDLNIRNAAKNFVVA